MAFDLTEIDLKADAERGSWMQLRDPRSNQPLFADRTEKKPKEDCSLHLLGVEADVVRAALEKIEKRRQKRERERYDALIEGGDSKKEALEGSKSTKEELLQDDAELIAAATTGWRHIAWKGEEEFSEKVIIDFYLNRDWALRQAQFYIANHANFMKGQGND